MVFRFFERFFVVLVLLACMHVFIALANPGLGEDDPDAVSTELHMSTILVDGGVYACGALLILMRLRKFARAARAAWPILALPLLAMFSAAWSAEPELTFRRGLFLLFSTLLAVYLGERYSMDKLARLTAQTMCLMMMAVIALYFVAPAYVIDFSSHAGALKGLSTHKNPFGEYMAVAFLLLLLVRFRHFAWLRYVFLAIAGGMLLLTHSAGAVACCALAFAAMPIWNWFRLNHRQRLLFCSISVVLVAGAVYFALNHSELLLHALGRDSTFSGRIQLWATLWPAILKQPVLGYGYQTFWAGLQGEALNARIGLQWLASAADNGYIDLCLSLGFTGAIAFLWIFARFFRQAIAYLRTERGPLGLWPVTYFFFFAVHNVAESTLLARATFSFLAFAMIATSLAVSRYRATSDSQPAEIQEVLFDDGVVLAG